MALYPCPGLDLFATLEVSAPVRALMAAFDQVFAVAGDGLYTVARDGTVTRRGTIADDGLPASLSNNGAAGKDGGQVFITSGGHGYCYTVSTAALVEITLERPAITGTFMDRYFFAFSSTGFQISGFMADGTSDGTSWDPADITTRSGGADPVVSGLQNHREIWLWGEITTEVWYDTGGADFPFSPIPGVFIEVGCGAPYSVARFDHQVAWIAQNRDGDRMAVLAAQYIPQRISTHAVEMAWRRYSTVRDAIAFVYQEDGHTFYQVSFPTDQATWVYDGATQLWHERAYWNASSTKGGVFEASRVRTHCRAFERHIVGDRQTGDLYVYNMLTGTDNGATIRRMRRTPHLAKENVRTFLSRLEVDLEAGLGLNQGQGSDPQVMLRWSDDRAHTWSNEWWTSGGRMGQFMARAYFLRLGSARDRVFEITVSDPIPWRLIDGYVQAEGGAS